MKTSIKIHFTLTGKFEPEEITSSLCIVPTKTWRFGDLIDNTHATYKHDGWRLSSDETESLDLNEQIMKIINVFHPYSLQLKEICKKLDLDSEIACAICIENDQYPSIHFNREVLSKISDMNTEIDIDIY